MAGNNTEKQKDTIEETLLQDQEQELSLIADDIEDTDDIEMDDDVETDSDEDMEAAEAADLQKMHQELSRMKMQREKKAFSATQLKERIREITDWMFERKKIIGPVLLGVCIVLTIVIALSANKKKESDAQQVGTEAVAVADEGVEVPQQALEQNAYPEINELMVNYYKALAAGDMDTICTLVSPVTETYLIKLREVSKYLEAYPAVNIYTKPGPIENSFMVFAYTEVQMAGYDKAYVPGLATFYVCQNEEGKYYINIQEELDEDVASYIESIDLQDDVIDLNNKVTVDFNNLLAEDEDFAAYYTEVDNQITAAVGAALDELNATEEEPEEVATTEEPSSENDSTTKIVAATDVVNMRSSDSEIADKVGKAQIGDRFTLLEQRANGWSKVLADGQEVFIKSDYLEIVEETPAENTETEPQEAQAVNTSLGSDGYVTATTTVNVRAAANQTSEKLGKVYQGERLELIANQADGWCKIKYKGKTGYVKAEFME